MKKIVHVMFVGNPTARLCILDDGTDVMSDRIIGEAAEGAYLEDHKVSDRIDYKVVSGAPEECEK